MRIVVFSFVFSLLALSVSATLPQDGNRLPIPAVQQAPSVAQTNMPPLMQTINPSIPANAVAKQEVIPNGNMRIDLTPNHLSFIAGGTIRAFKHRTLIYNLLSGQWSEIDGRKAVMDVVEFEVHLWIAKQISNYLSKHLPIQGMGGAVVQLGYMAFAETYLTRQRLKGMISMIDETKVSFADEVAENFDFLGKVVVAKLVTQVNLNEKGQTTTFVLNKEVKNTEMVTAFIFRIEGNVVYKVAIFTCKPKHTFVHEKKTHFLLELADDTCKRTSDDVVYMMNL
jgi:hypothetical protein